MPTIKFTAVSQPYSTDDAILAFCLYVCGVPFADPRQPCTNRYTTDTLKRHGHVGKVNLLEAARACIAAGKMGDRRFHFGQTPVGLLDIYKAQAKELKEGEDVEGGAAAVIRQVREAVKSGEMDETEGLLRETCVTLKMYVVLRNLWKSLPGEVRIENTGKAKEFDTIVNTTDTRGTPITRAARGVAHPGWKIVSTNATPELLKRMKLI